MIKNIDKRFWEIDLLRGIAVVMLIFFHFLYDVNFFGIYKLSLYSGYFLIYVYMGGTLFLMLVGISLTLSYSRVKGTFTKKQLQLKYLRRGVKIFGLGMIITLVTWVYLDKGFIVFGALHCIGISIILAYPFLQLRYKNLILGIILILIGILLKFFFFDFYWLVWLGFTPAQFYTVDYFPLLPWFGVVLVGVFIGNSLYPNHKRHFDLKDLSRYRAIQLFCFLGRHSLIIYFLHQLILIGVIHILI
ncbi:MAG: heparan-alpha-glucosaminide N-acetyltransferase [Petrotogales bacterium]